MRSRRGATPAIAFPVAHRPSTGPPHARSPRRPSPRANARPSPSPPIRRRRMEPANSRRPTWSEWRTAITASATGSSTVPTTAPSPTKGATTAARVPAGRPPGRSGSAEERLGAGTALRTEALGLHPDGADFEPLRIAHPELVEVVIEQIAHFLA